MKHIAFAKIGKSIKFKTAFSPIGGDNEPGSMLRILANNNPDKTFYLIGKSDFRKLSYDDRITLFPYDNVVDVLTGYKNENRDYLKNKLASMNITIDYSIFMIGQIGTVTIPNRIEQIKDRSLTASVIEMTLGYSTPIIEWINSEKVPFIEIVNDPRYTLAQSRDIIENPVKTLSQFTGTYEKKTIRSYEDQTRENHTINTKYAEMEKIFLYDRKFPINIDKNTNFVMILNEGHPSRFQQVKEWILDNIEHANIYGKWEHPLSLPYNNFKGTIQIEHAQRLLTSVKYTFIIPILKGWATSKYIEMIQAGVIPFFHPDYASEVPEVLKRIPEFLICKKPEDLGKKIKFLNDSDELREKILALLQKEFLTDDMYDGTKLNDIVMSSINSDYVRVNKGDYKKLETNLLDGLFK